MPELKVDIVKLKPMTVAATLGFGQTPELEAWETIKNWAIPIGLFDDPKTRTFGFNNPNPSHGSPNYGYELWITVESGTEIGDNLALKEFPGGLYAVTQFKNIENIGDVWQQLVAWRENSQYKAAHHQWLEELLTSPDVLPEDYVFNLYLPIRE